MLFHKIISEGIAHNSYLIGDSNQACIIDPRRDIDSYLDLLAQHELTIKYIFETHRNEDYIIGSCELAQQTKAEIFHGPQTPFKYGTTTHQGATYPLGSFTLHILETPGHTLDSISILLKNTQHPTLPYMIFTGDALFAGDVGRIDFYGENKKPDMAELLYNSIHQTILPLGTHLIICPAHGKGSICGGDISDLYLTTTGYELQTNPILKKTKTEFISHKTQEHHYMPPYFQQAETMNQNGPPLHNKIPLLQPYSVAEIKTALEQKTQVIDIRFPEKFAPEHIPKTLNIWLKGVPMFAGWFLNYHDPIIIINDSETPLELAQRYLHRLGFDNITGYLHEGFNTWKHTKESTQTIDQWSAQELAQKLQDNLFILDVREITIRQKTGYIPKSQNIYVGELPKHLSSIPHDKTIVIYCDKGFKTSIATSFLKQHNYSNLVNLKNGFNSWLHHKLPIIKDSG